VDVLEKIRKLQREKGWNSAQLAEKANLTPSTLSTMFKRNNQPTIATLQSLCSAFGITIAQFFADGNVPPDLSPEQADLLERWNTLTDEQRVALIALIKSM
jgi:transcriptional regulator with XRE-family HTH domain